MNLRSYLTIFSALLAQASANCQCNEVNSWEEFKALVVAANDVESQSPQKIILCPFKITKVIDENMNHWDQFIPIKKPMHITCQKQNPEDRCWIEINGEECNFGENCGRAMIKIRSDDVTIDGLKVTDAKDNIIIVDDGKKNIRLIDIEMFKNTVPGNESGAPTSLIFINPQASVQIINSFLSWNSASVVENRGSLMIHGSTMNGNDAESTIVNRSNGDLAITSTVFALPSTGSRRAIQSSQAAEVFDGGLNCASGSAQCNGIFTPGIGCIPLLEGGCA